jgi:MFS superfamily sulfate permease-like transporter
MLIYYQGFEYSVKEKQEIIVAVATIFTMVIVDIVIEKTT